MSLLLVMRHLGDQGPPPGSPGAAALDAVAGQGFADPVSFGWSGGVALLFPTPGNPRGSGAWVREGERFAASVGAFHWNGAAGGAALRRLLAHEGPIGSLAVSAMSGSFLVLLGRPDGVWLFNDAVGVLKAYEGAGGVISTSMLACRATIARPGVNRMRAQEYVLFGGNHGLETPIEGLKLVDPTCARELISGRVVPMHAAALLSGGPRPESAAASVEQARSEIAREFRGLITAYGPDIGMALSGGFDSRLVLAALDHVGVRPHLFVYGRRDDPDVAVAQAVARHLDMPIEAIDKATLERERPPLSRALLAANLRFFDGLPGDGIFDRGSDQATRLRQVEGGRLNLNGGGGEILRNFFYLPDRAYSAQDLVAAFYSGWFEEVFVDADDRAAFVSMFEGEILASLGREGGSRKARAQALPRSEVELVYSLFRLRYWMGRNNAIAARYGAFMTPLVTPALVRFAAAVPIAWKEFGRLEASTITALSPRVASAPSGYGFAFSEGPSWRHRLKTSMTLLRPIALRRRSLPLQRALGRVRPATAPREWCDALGEAPRADWLNPDALSHADQMNRLLTLQALLSPLSPGGER